VRRAVAIAPLLLIVALTLSACSLQSYLPNPTLVSATATPQPTIPPTVPPVDQSNVNSYDNNAGDCHDAAGRAIDLISQAAGGAFGGFPMTADMRLDLQPSDSKSGCSDTAHIVSYRQNVGSAKLTVWPLDAVWPVRDVSIRRQWLADVLTTLNRLYPKATISIQVTYGDSPCGTATLGPGSSGGAQIDPTCY
jgi:hypothetical protein